MKVFATFVTAVAICLFFPGKTRAADIDASVSSAPSLADASASDAYAAIVSSAYALIEQAEHGNFAVRKECDAKLVAMGEAAVPALIVRMKKSGSESMRKWCEDVLDEMGKRTAADQVQTKSDDALIAVFGAFAETKDVDNLPAIFPFVGSSRLAIRNAARDTLRAYGDLAAPRLHAEYINLGGQIPTNVAPTTAQLLDSYLALRDRLRLQDVTALFDKGIGEAKTDLPTAITDLDEALAREPMLDRRKEAAPIYLQYAHDLARTDRRAGRAYALKAMRTAEVGSSDIARAESEIAYFDAEDLRAGGLVNHEAQTRDGRLGIVDRDAYLHALALDPQNGDAKGALAEIDRESDEGRDKLHKTEAAGAALAATAAFAFGFYFLFRRRKTTRL